jgi:hypothetical protein
VIVNVGHPDGNDDLERVLGRTMADVFPNVLRDPVEQENTLLIASEAPTSAARLSAARVNPELRSLVLIDAARVGPRLPGGSVYTDDKAPVEWLTDKSIVGYAAGE